MTDSHYNIQEWFHETKTKRVGIIMEEFIDE